MSEYDYLFKIIVVGDGAVGKTAITIRFAEGRFEEHYKMTIGVDFAIKLVEVSGYKIKMQVWDTGGQERFSYIRPLYYKGAMAGLAIFDLTNRESYDNLPKWFTEVAENCGGIPIMLVGNKADLPDRAVTSEEAQTLSQKMGIPYFEASAKNGRNVNQLFENLATMLITTKLGIESKAPVQPVIEPTPMIKPVAPSPPPVTAPLAPPLAPAAPPPPPTFAPASLPPPPTFSPPPTIQAPVKPQSAPQPISFSPPPTPSAPSPSQAQPMEVPSRGPPPSLDEALEILRGGTDEAAPKPAPQFELPQAPYVPPPEPKVTIPKPPTMPPPPTLTPKPVALEPISLEPMKLEKPPEPPPAFQESPFQAAPLPPTIPSSVPIMPEFSPAPAPSESRPSAIPFGAASSDTDKRAEIPFTSAFAPSSSEPETADTGFVAFVPGPIERPKPIEADAGSTWISFLKREPVEEEEEEEKEPKFIPFLVSDAARSPIKEELEDIVLEVVKKEEPKSSATSRERVCSNCHQTISGDWKFCTYCGSRMD